MGPPPALGHARSGLCLPGTEGPSLGKLERARLDIAASYPGRPRVLDMFGGGGTIPFEAANLGADAYSVELNELAVFLQRSLLEYAASVPRAALLDVLADSGARVMAELAHATAPLFPRRPEVMTYLWTYMLACTGCGYRFFLRKRPWLSRKKQRRLALCIQRGEQGDRVEIAEVDDSLEPSVAWLGRSRQAACPVCGLIADDIAVGHCDDALVAEIKRGPNGKEFGLPASSNAHLASRANEIEEAALEALGQTLPASSMPRWSGIVNPPLHGLSRHVDLFNSRQRAVLVTLISVLKREYQRLCTACSPALARAAIGLLAGLIDQLVDGIAVCRCGFHKTSRSVGRSAARGSRCYGITPKPTLWAPGRQTCMRSCSASSPARAVSSICHRNARSFMEALVPCRFPMVISTR